MPIYEICIKRYGKTYCWNSKEKRIEEICRKPLKVSECPSDVVQDFLNLLDKANGKLEEK